MTLPREYLSWFQELLVPATWSAVDGRRSAAGRFLAPAGDTPRRWVQVWAMLLTVGLLSSITSGIGDGVGWLDILAVPFLLYVAVTSLLRAKTLLSGTRDR